MSKILIFIEIMWENYIEWDSPQVTTRSMRIACWITEARDRRSE